ncbi:MAG: M20/M25/M40 family metallo-hydrolase [Chloroflexi bacterium]|nr:M20/M25/M40 family metallo-hydrolase [Chloroflexota bacterium]
MTLDTNWDAIGREAADILSRYIRIDTSNPPGGEANAALFLAELLSREGIESQTHEPAPERVNLVARFGGPGTAARKPLLLMHHMDVVPAVSSSWQVPPFAGELRDGYVWGRGAIDDKGLGTIHLMAFILMKRLGIRLDRELIFMAVADEEEGGALGARWMVENHWPAVECEYVWDEGGTGSQGIIGRSPVFAVSVSEKTSMVVTLTATGIGGHGSMARGTPVDRLVSALLAVRRIKSGMRFDEVTKEFFRRVAETQPAPVSWVVRRAGNPVFRPVVSRAARKSPVIDAMLRDTITTTVVQAGGKANVAADEASAILDVRLLPSTDPGRFLEELRSAIDDDGVTVEALETVPSPPPSPMDSALFRAFERAVSTHVPGAITTPIQTPVATDSRFFRPLGVKAYGLLPAVMTAEDLETIHGANERISLDNLTLGVKIAADVVREVCSTVSLR